MDSHWMIYGAYGYTGQLIAKEAVARGLRPILAGRNRKKTEALANSLGCMSRVFSLKDVDRAAEALLGLKAVLHCAGPFSATGEPMMEACLRAKTHYLDITGEISVIEAAALRDSQAQAARICMLPAVGFDVVPTDCLAAMLVERLPEAHRLELAFAGPRHVSPGTMKTMLEGLAHGGRIRQDNKITHVKVAWKSKEISFRHGVKTAVTVPWGDVASAWYTTGIPNIEVYLAIPREQIEGLKRARRVFPILGRWPFRVLLAHMVSRTVHGPTPEERQAGRASFWGRVSDTRGNAIAATLETPSGYRLTAQTALACLQRVMNGEAPYGFSTPAKAFGARFILDIPETDFRFEEDSSVREIGY